jgi:hypothetical protein
VLTQAREDQLRLRQLRARRREPVSPLRAPNDSQGDSGQIQKTQENQKARSRQGQSQKGDEDDRKKVVQENRKEKGKKIDSSVIRNQSGGG